MMRNAVFWKAEVIVKPAITVNWNASATSAGKEASVKRTAASAVAHTKVFDLLSTMIPSRTSSILSRLLAQTCPMTCCDVLLASNAFQMTRIAFSIDKTVSITLVGVFLKLLKSKVQLIPAMTIMAATK